MNVFSIQAARVMHHDQAIAWGWQVINFTDNRIGVQHMKNNGEWHPSLR
jgi:hypothetical protein